jgi:hypothetical protein
VNLERGGLLLRSLESGFTLVVPRSHLVNSLLGDNPALATRPAKIRRALRHTSVERPGVAPGEQRVTIQLRDCARPVMFTPEAIPTSHGQEVQTAPIRG